MNADDLREIPLFAGLEADMRALLADLLKEGRFEKAETIFREGTADDRLFFIRRGTVEIRKQTGQGAADTLLAVLGPGDFFGEMGVFLDAPRSADAVALEPVETCWIARSDLDGLFEKNPSDSFRIMAFLATVLMSRLRDTSDELVLVQRAGARLARATRRRDVASEVLEELCEAIPVSEGGLIAVWNEYNDEYDVLASRSTGTVGEITLGADDPLVALLSGAGRPVAISRLSRDLRPEGCSFLPGAEASFVGVPLPAGDRISGFALLWSRGDGGRFTHRHLIVASCLANHATLALENIRLLEENANRDRLAIIRAQYG